MFGCHMALLLHAGQPRWRTYCICVDLVAATANATGLAGSIRGGAVLWRGVTSRLQQPAAAGRPAAPAPAAATAAVAYAFAAAAARQRTAPTPGRRPATAAAIVVGQTAAAAAVSGQCAPEAHIGGPGKAGPTAAASAASFHPDAIRKPCFHVRATADTAAEGGLPTRLPATAAAAAHSNSVSCCPSTYVWHDVSSDKHTTRDLCLHESKQVMRVRFTFLCSLLILSRTKEPQPLVSGHGTLQSSCAGSIRQQAFPTWALPIPAGLAVAAADLEGASGADILQREHCRRRRRRHRGGSDVTAPAPAAAEAGTSGAWGPAHVTTTGGSAAAAAATAALAGAAAAHM